VPTVVAPEGFQTQLNVVPSILELAWALDGVLVRLAQARPRIDSVKSFGRR